MISSPATTPAGPATRFRPVIRVFVSSTFSDLTHERNALQDRTWPELERYCLLRGFQFQAIDLRWGITEEEVSRGALTSATNGCVKTSR